MDHEQAESIERAAQDRDHLRLLSIFHYVVAAFTALSGCFPMIYLIMGIAIFFGGLTHSLPANDVNQGGPIVNHNDDGAAVVFGGVFVAISSFMILMAYSLAFAAFLAGRDLAKPRHYTFCLVVAAIECLMMPFGTILGVFTIIVLMRPSVKAMFQANDAAG